MNFKLSLPEIKFSKPVFTKETKEIVSLLQQLSFEEMKDLMAVNQQQAEVVFPQIQQLGGKNTVEAPSAFVYNGIAYKGLDFSTLNEEDIQFAQEHFLIMSAVYGFLSPLDVISPYRLEMQAKLKNSRGNTLYDYWKETLSTFLAKKLSKDDGIWLNLCSDEYSKTIDPKILPPNTQIITPQFREETSKGYRQVVVHTKKARGLMTRFVIQNKISSVDDLKAFDVEGYCFAEHLSKRNELVFIR